MKYMIYDKCFGVFEVYDFTLIISTKDVNKAIKSLSTVEK